MSTAEPSPVSDTEALDQIAIVLREAGHDSNHRNVLVSIATLVRQTGRAVRRVGRDSGRP